ncbi:prephenate dehydrogenase/arogenate dehydrogenase family protein, partial [Sulfurivirga sp.]|uniref:prephenate dehydrogenase n=1 Tax=Sulfurivirga sp. TaxID=2614236 RepID=UPI0025D55DDD
MFERAVIIGVGLIGGSLALALKKNDLVREVIGISRSPDTLAEAVHLGVIDSGGTRLEQAHVDGADLIFIATPLGAFPAVFDRLASLELEADVLITDGGSAKQHVIDAARAAFGDALPGGFVPGHPIAGKELSGVAAADAELYVDHRVILTPAESSDARAVKRVESMWQA